MKLDGALLAQDAMTSTVPLSLAGAVKRGAIIQYMGAFGAKGADVFKLIGDESIEEAFYSGLHTLQSSPADTHVQKKWTEIVAPNFRNSIVMTSGDRAERDTLLFIIDQMGREFAFNRESMGRVCSLAFGKAQILPEIQSDSDRMNLSLVVIRRVIQQRVREIFEEKGLIKQQESVCTLEEINAENTLFVVQEGVRSTCAELALILGLEAAIPEQYRKKNP